MWCGRKKYEHKLAWTQPYQKIVGHLFCLISLLDHTAEAVCSQTLREVGGLSQQRSGFCGNRCSSWSLVWFRSTDRFLVLHLGLPGQLLQMPGALTKCSKREFLAILCRGFVYTLQVFAIGQFPCSTWKSRRACVISLHIFLGEKTVASSIVCLIVYSRVDIVCLTLTMTEENISNGMGEKSSAFVEKSLTKISQLLSSTCDNK